ncbi:hypothetical protein [Kitasatospora cheerisanensis]|uniref:Uncharacterized protein n=1 Tax=Kitasatospora cheerisanensis KCTC 2395 TaxID=1348663 RepID=A0A066YRQ0_9ACTN|nr:hypothetical protein [Kitasatospora cheerisanensis]KDN80751.1 hypothetical protein KCH_75310 [Kitasatospora cheerisanensis KCTC 2395]
MLTLAATNTYLTGAAELTEALLPPRPNPGRRGSYAVVATTAVTGAPLILLVGSGALTTSQLVAVPTALFLTVYLACTAAAIRVLDGPARLAAAVCCPAVLALLLGTGWPVLAAAAVALAAAFLGQRSNDSAAPHGVPVTERELNPR